MNFLRASIFNFKRLKILRNSIKHPSKNLLLFELASSLIFNFECLDILQDSIKHPSKELLSFEFAQSLCFQYRAARYITVLNRTSKWKVIVVSICSEFLLSMSSFSIYCGFNMLQASAFNFKRVDILRDSIRHWNKNQLSFEFAQSFYFQFRASRYITGHNRTSE